MARKRLSKQKHRNRAKGINGRTHPKPQHEVIERSRLINQTVTTPSFIQTSSGCKYGHSNRNGHGNSQEMCERYSRQQNPAHLASLEASRVIESVVDYSPFIYV